MFCWYCRCSGNESGPDDIHLTSCEVKKPQILDSTDQIYFPFIKQTEPVGMDEASDHWVTCPDIRDSSRQLLHDIIKTSARSLTVTLKLRWLKTLKMWVGLQMAEDSGVELRLRRARQLKKKWHKTSQSLNSAQNPELPKLRRWARTLRLQFYFQPPSLERMSGPNPLPPGFQDFIRVSSAWPAHSSE